MAKILRILFVLAAGGIGTYVASKTGYGYLYGALAGLICAGLVIGVEIILLRRTAREIIGAAVGLALGLIVANLAAFAVCHIRYLVEFRGFIFVFANMMVGYLGVVIGLRKRDELMFLNLFMSSKRTETGALPKLLDTSVVIDGRIADVVETGFFEGPLIVPRFVLRELQRIADSSDSLRRARGRRGLEALNRIQRSDVKVIIDETDFPDIEDVDSKLVKLAKLREAKIATGDYNLNRIADLHGVGVLNVNDLATALRPVLLPGEEISVRLIKKGKELGQAVGFLEDGTMVVVDDAVSRIGTSVSCEVTSVLQTTAGRLVFTRLKNGTARKTWNGGKQGQNRRHPGSSQRQDANRSHQRPRVFRRFKEYSKR